MIAIILNSGMGTRMGDMTQERQKCMVVLKNGETILQRQLRLLYRAGIRDFVITTGPYEDVLRERALATLPNCRFTFVNNPVYASTNYIYSLYLAREHFHDDAVMLHGDLVFDSRLPGKMLQDPRPRLAAVNYAHAIPEKDFKARVQDGSVCEIGVNVFGEDCYAMQPFYKMDRAMLEIWMDRIAAFVENDQKKCYAENALNELMPAIGLLPYDCSEDYIEEIDTPDDYHVVCDQIRLFDFDSQRVESSIETLPALLAGMKRPMLVCDGAYEFLPVKEVLAAAGIQPVRFSDFRPNPRYEEALAGAALFLQEECDGLLAVGGGSAIDTAKCIKLMAALRCQEPDAGYDTVFSATPLIAVPSTAGTGSECTRYAVAYKNGEKQSITSDCIYPDVAVLDPRLLTSLPLYQRRASYLDALCHAIESAWSVNACDCSRPYSLEAIRILTEAFTPYFTEGAQAPSVMQGAYLAGRAINLTQTTAGHAMCYKLTSLYGIAHGHAAALCVRSVWKLLLDRYAKGNLEQPVTAALEQIAAAAGCATPLAAWEQFCHQLEALEIAPPVADFTPDELATLAASVNPTRLVNFPVALTTQEITAAYQAIIS